MESFEPIELGSGLITWFIAQDIVIADDVAAGLFGLGEDECDLGVDIGVFLARISEKDRGRISQALYDCIADSDGFHEVFEILVCGTPKVVVMKGRSVGDVLFTCIVTELDEGSLSGKLVNLCLAAYELARQEKNDIAAMQLVRTLSLITASPTEQHLH